MAGWGAQPKEGGQELPVPCVFGIYFIYLFILFIYFRGDVSLLRDVGFPELPRTPPPFPISRYCRSASLLAAGGAPG